MVSQTHLKSFMGFVWLMLRSYVELARNARLLGQSKKANYNILVMLWTEMWLVCNSFFRGEEEYLVFNTWERCSITGLVRIAASNRRNFVGKIFFLLLWKFVCMVNELLAFLQNLEPLGQLLNATGKKILSL